MNNISPTSKTSRLLLKRGTLLPVLPKAILILLLAGVLFSCTSKVQQQIETPEGKAAIEPNIKVCLTENLHSGILSFEGNYILELEEARYMFGAEIGPLEALFKSGNLILKNNRRYFELPFTQTVVFRPELSSARFVWNEIPYSGELWFHISENKITVVNKLPLETYLYGVVPYEIPTTQEEYQEAIYAQTIAARTYALYRMDNPAGQHYDVWADSRDQIYQGMLKIPPLADKAIHDTRGITLSNSSQAAIAYFHSTCGGVLEVSPDSLNAFTNVNDIFTYDLTDNEYNCKVSPYYRWVEVRDLETVLWNLSHEFGFDSLLVREWLETGCRMDINVTLRKQSGRIEEVNFKIEDKEFIATGIRIRRIFADRTGKLLPSNFFFINESPGNWEKFYIIGAGAGHGRGMCQWGAIGLALKGNSYRNILGFYYPNLKMVKFY
jgi:stage II sporulation protein D